MGSTVLSWRCSMSCNETAPTQQWKIAGVPIPNSNAQKYTQKCPSPLVELFVIYFMFHALLFCHCTGLCHAFGWKLDESTTDNRHFSAGKHGAFDGKMEIVCSVFVAENAISEDVQGVTYRSGGSYLGHSYMKCVILAFLSVFIDNCRF